MPTTYAIPNGRTAMDATTYTATGTTQAVTNSGTFKPDLVWTKNRSGVSAHYLMDSVRGASLNLQSQSTGAEASLPNYLTSFNSNGFTIGTDNYANGTSVVGWQWQAGQGSNVSNTTGTITSTVSANATAGFSVVTYTGNGTNGATVGHGLGVAPSFIILKGRGAVTDWPCYHASIGSTAAILLNRTDTISTSALWFNNTAPTSSVFSLGTISALNGSGATVVAYCWSEIAGFSKFGSYTGNGSTDGPFVYLGFRPKFVLFKNSSATADWVIVDSSRSTYNLNNLLLYPDLSSAEATASDNTLDFLSNGFKIRGTSSGALLNGSGNTIIYAAFAENPFKYSNAR